MDSTNKSGFPTEFRPERLSRRGEVVAWVTSLMGITAWGMLLVLGEPVHFALKALTVALVLVAIAISLGNWMDRRTFIFTDNAGIHFENGLRRVRLDWDDIQQVEVFPSNWGDKVRVKGSSARFGFRTFGKVEVGGEVKGSMGFSQGDHILEQILGKAQLKEIQQPGNGYYYVRD